MLFCLHLPLHFTTTHCLSLPLQAVSFNSECYFVFIFLSTSLPHIVYLYHCRDNCNAAAPPCLDVQLCCRIYPWP
ncbi:hypothetical protein GBAR_LOCUS19128 [Geodia barretti]|uniref:Secreted protein n=1 Tax=Geodia barretti TaxID=519541 RepID=A0AA35SPN1_GEOBA|nr:hypothetical protein GBAR_LOCUS19128 [Geodia barretti]